MHKSVFNQCVRGVQVALLFTGQIPQHFLCGRMASLYAYCAHSFRSLCTRQFNQINLLFGLFTHYTQALLQKLYINKLLIEG
jgi:hypothetical protein